MSVHPILIDSVPPFLEGWDSQPSLLLLPIGADSLVGHLSSRLARVSPHRPIVLPPPDAAPGFAEEVDRGGTRGARRLRPVRRGRAHRDLRALRHAPHRRPAQLPCRRVRPGDVPRCRSAGPAVGRSFRHAGRRHRGHPRVRRHRRRGQRPEGPPVLRERHVALHHRRHRVAPAGLRAHRREARRPLARRPARAALRARRAEPRRPSPRHGDRPPRRDRASWR